MVLRFALVIAALSLTATARANPVVTTVGGAQVDWTRGVIVARVVAPADRHAPSPAVARSGSRRAAEDRARARLRAAARALPWAGGGTVGDQLGTRAEAVAALERAVERARVISADYVTDGSVRVDVALPIEAVRQAVAGPRRLAAADIGPTAIVVDARSVKVAPALGLGLRAGSATLRGPVLLATARPGPDLLGPRPIEARATRAAGGALTVDGKVEDAPDALIVVLVAPHRGR